MTLSVLIAEDEPSIVMSLRFLMEKQGYDVRVVENGDDAVSAFAEGAPDVLLLDVMMPGRDGFEVLQEVRANEAWAKTRVIMLSARGRDVDRDKGMALGADLYVVKPFSTRDLVDQVARLGGGPRDAAE